MEVYAWLTTDSDDLNLQEERAKLARKQTERMQLQIDEMKGSW